MIERTLFFKLLFICGQFIEQSEQLYLPFVVSNVIDLIELLMYPDWLMFSKAVLHSGNSGMTAFSE